MGGEAVVVQLPLLADQWNGVKSGRVVQRVCLFTHFTVSFVPCLSLCMFCLRIFQPLFCGSESECCRCCWFFSSFLRRNVAEIRKRERANELKDMTVRQPESKRERDCVCKRCLQMMQLALLHLLLKLDCDCDCD